MCSFCCSHRPRRRKLCVSIITSEREREREAMNRRNRIVPPRRAGTITSLNRHLSRSLEYIFIRECAMHYLLIYLINVFNSDMLARRLVFDFPFATVTDALKRCEAHRKLRSFGIVTRIKMLWENGKRKIQRPFSYSFISF